MSPSARSRPLALIVAALFLPLAAFAPAVPATSDPDTLYWSEDFESGLDGWTVIGAGASVDCLSGDPGCSLWVMPPCCSQPVSLTHPVDVPVDDFTQVSFSFMPESASGDTDTNFVLSFDGGFEAFLHPSDYPEDWYNGDNIGVTFWTTSGDESKQFADWPNPGVWYGVVIVFQQEDRALSVELRTSGGDLIAASDALPVPAEVTVLQGIRVDATTWTSRSNAFRFDTLAVEGITPQSPAAPRNLRAAPGIHRIDLSWDAPEEPAGTIAGYRVYRATMTGGFEPHADAGPGSRFSDEGLGNDETYRYRVAALHQDGSEGPVSRVARATTYGPPAAPRNLDAWSSSASNGLSWDAPLVREGAPALLEYNVYRTGPDGARVLAGVVPGGLTLYEDATAPLGVEVAYEVTAVNVLGESPASASATAAAGTPAAPYDVAAVFEHERARLSWSTMHEALKLAPEHFVVEREGPDGVATFLTTGTALLDEGLTNGENYTYTVRAANRFGVGERSAPVTGSPTPEISMPAPFTAVRHGKDGIALTWDAPAVNGHRVTSYVLARRTSWWTGYEPLATLDGSARTYVDSGLEMNRTYAYRIVATDGVRNSSFDYAAKTLFPSLGPPENLTAEAGLGANRISWNDPAPSSYRYWSAETCVYRSTEAEPTPVRIGCEGTYFEAFWDYDVVPGVAYTYTLTTVWDGLESEHTAPVTVRWSPV